MGAEEHALVKALIANYEEMRVIAGETMTRTSMNSAVPIPVICTDWHKKAEARLSK